MHQSVIDTFVAFTEPMEGKTPSLYPDIKGLITCGLGCLCDPIDLALPLPWIMPDGTSASQGEIARQWHAVKDHSAQLSRLHWKYSQAYTSMRLTEEGIKELAAERLAANERILRTHFASWDDFPADAQLAVCSMAWACGANFPAMFANFKRLMNEANFLGAIEACKIREDNNPGLRPRNAANRLCLGNAWKASQLGLPRGELFWPGVPPTSGDKEWKLRSEAAAALAAHPPHFGWDTAGREVADQDKETKDV